MKRIFSLFILALAFAGIAQAQRPQPCVVTGSINNALAQPQAGITVNMWQIVNGSPDGNTQIQTTTDSGGIYSFSSKYAYPPYSNSLVCSTEYLIEPSNGTSYFDPQYYTFVSPAPGYTASGIFFTMYNP